MLTWRRTRKSEKLRCGIAYFVKESFSDNRLFVMTRSLYNRLTSQSHTRAHAHNDISKMYSNFRIRLEERQNDTGNMKSFKYRSNMLDFIMQMNVFPIKLILTH